MKTDRLIAILLSLTLGGCSYATTVYLHIIPQSSQSSLELMRVIEADVSTWPEFSNDAKCEEHGRRYQSTFRSKQDKSILVSLVLNTGTDSLAFVFTQLGVRQLSPDAEALLGQLAPRLRSKAGNSNVLRVAGPNEHALIAALKGDSKELRFCNKT
jgi:hypothetical protein